MDFSGFYIMQFKHKEEGITRVLYFDSLVLSIIPEIIV